MVRSEQKSLPKMASLHQMAFYLKNFYETQNIIFFHVPIPPMAYDQTRQLA